MTALINPETLSLDSFLLNHSKQYGIAALASVIEYFVEVYFCPGKNNFLVLFQPVIFNFSNI